ncbi:MAG: signal recognition particle-docking protein FtsY [Clostridia bacterium]
MGLFQKISEGIKKTKQNFSKKLFFAFSARDLDDDFYENLEEALLSADVGIAASTALIDELKDKIFEKKVKTSAEAKEILKVIMTDSISYEITPYEYPLVLLMCGVNGVGKTTAVGKLAHLFREQGKSVVVAAADTFRAAASEQLEVWGERAGVRVIRHDEGSDPAAVVFDAISSAKAKKTDVVLIDTAGRLHNKKNLMEELKKICRVVSRELPNADFRTFLVLDATTGQNAIAQAETFGEAAETDGIILTKLDGTAKGGVVLAISEELELPVLYVGVGEKIDDLIPFNPQEFVSALLSE